MNKTSIFQIVVARYNENFDWLLPYYNICVIYNKGMPILNTVSLPNVGRESHTYLYHIINNWDTLADNTLFTQGEIYSHQPYPLSIYNKADFVMNYKNKGILFINNSYKLLHSGKWYLELYTGNMRKAKYNFVEWWHRYVKKPLPDFKTLKWSSGAIFSVSRKKIQANPKEYYIDLLSCIDNHINPEEGHYFERSWYYIFN